MDTLHQNILTFMRKYIVADMNVENGIIQPLKSEYILSNQDVEKILAGASNEERAEILLDILPSRGADAFNAFRESLRHHYEWLTYDMDRIEETHKTVSHKKQCTRPTLPPVSPLTVNREQKMTQLKDHLEGLEPNGYVVLHGMKGFGKSCLTASTLKNTTFVMNAFHNEVYWIKFGYTRPIDEEILVQLNKLYHDVKNIEMSPEPLKPEPLKDSLIHFLKRYFSDEKHHQALLILDDVCNSEVIETFDFECKTLVITADLDVVLEKRPFVIEMNNGFTVAETLGLFAKVLETDVDKLPPEAKQIHYECKGMPLLIAMFSAQFEEFKHDMKIRSDRWTYYLDSLRNKDKKNHVIKKFFEKQEAIFDMCIQQLPVEMRKRYEELVIFAEDVNITPQTLEILWEGCPFQVEEMMLDLCHKSLAAKQWNHELRSYIYGVHDLLLCHLRKNFSSIELIEMHKSLIRKYSKYCNDDFSKLPADNYSYSYIGHHLEQAQMFDKFRKIYFDFDFIQATIIHSGLSNLLIDLNTYRIYITDYNEPTLEACFTDLEKLLKEQAGVIAEHRRKQCLDIIQIAMNHPYPGFVKDTAIKLAKERSKNLYVLHDKKLGQMDIPLSEEMSMEVRTSCFTSDPDQILIGNGAGEIYLWNSIYKRQKLFGGHNKSCSIKKIVVSSEADSFLSLDDHGTVKLFGLTDDENYNHNQTTLCPKQKQSFWSGIFMNKIPHDESLAVFTVNGETILDVTFAHNNNYVAACTDKGTIRVWDRYGKMVSDHTQNSQTNSYLKHITFTMESSLLHVMDEVHGVLISYRKYGEEYHYLTQYNPDLQKKKIIFFRNVPEQNNSLFIVTENKAIYVKWFRSSNDHLHSYNKQIRASVDNEKTVYICAALTNDGQYLVLADSSGFINIWNSDIGHQPIAAYKSRVSSLDTYWMKEEGIHIICGSENRLLHKWKLPVEGTCKSIRKPLFDAAVQKFGKPDIVVMETISNTITTLVGDEIIAETEPIDGKIMTLILSSDKKKIVYVTDKFVVYLFDVGKKESIPILKFLRNIEFVAILNIQNQYIITCRETNDNLWVWQNIKVSFLIESAGYIISIHEVNTNCALTVTRNGIITLWNINNTNWLKIDRVTIGSMEVVTIFSCLGHWKNILAVLNENGDAVLYKLQEDRITRPVSIKITEYFKKQYTQKCTCCEISQNELYLAIGFDNGDISIIDIFVRKEIHKLCFHSTPITHLYWAPSAIETPILLSVNSDELVWWNIDLAVYASKQNKRLRGGVNRSTSTPTVCKKANKNSRMMTSQSVDSSMYSMMLQELGNIQTDNMYNPILFWQSKKGKDPKQPGLLAVVELPSNFLAKVCISTDFTKFVTVDIYGSISTFTLCGCN